MRGVRHPKHRTDAEALPMIVANPARIVLTYGIFDPLSPDHALFLQRARRLGTHLIVGCGTDAYCARRGTVTLQPFETRREALGACRHVSRVIARDRLDPQRTDIVNYDVAVLAMPSLWQGAFDHLHHLAQVVYLPTGHSKTEAPPAVMLGALVG
jgi:glycerol-3-phosphate cytidylyltransferase